MLTIKWEQINLFINFIIFWSIPIFLRYERNTFLHSQPFSKLTNYLTKYMQSRYIMTLSILYYWSVYFLLFNNSISIILIANPYLYKINTCRKPLNINHVFQFGRSTFVNQLLIRVVYTDFFFPIR